MGRNGIDTATTKKTEEPFEEKQPSQGTGVGDERKKPEADMGFGPGVWSLVEVTGGKTKENALFFA